MSNRVEKLSLLSEMIAFAIEDNTLKPIEFNFLLGVSKQLDISREDFDYLISHPINGITLKSHSERIVQFHRLVLLAHLDSNKNPVAEAKLFNYGLKMGLNHDSIMRVLYLMDGFPDRMLPADVLIDIFRTQYN